MAHDPDFRYRQAPAWRITNEFDHSTEVGMVTYRLDIGIRHQRLIGYSFEANLPMLTDFISALLQLARPLDPLHIEAQSWLEDLGQLVQRDLPSLSHEAGDGGRKGFYFRCDMQPDRVLSLVTALWPWSSEFSVAVPATAPFTSPIQVQMFPEHLDEVDLIVSADDEPLIRNLFVPAA